MTMTEVRGDAGSSAKKNNVDLKLEVVVIPVSDVDRAKEFYSKLGWRLDADFPFDNGFRVVQFTPPGSGSSVQFGSKITSAAPGSAQEYLIVSDIEAARDQLAARGVEVSPMVPIRSSRAYAISEGIWTNREVTGMKTVPRRLLVLGGGPVGVEMAQAVHRLGGEVRLVDGAPNLLVHEAKPLGEALARSCATEGIELFLGATAAAARREGDEYILELDDGNRLSGIVAGRHGPSGRHREPRARDGWHGLRTRCSGRLAASCSRALMVGRRDHRDLAANARRQVPGRGRRGEHSRRAARGKP